MNRLFVAHKPPTLSSNHFLSRLKRKYGVKKAGFSGTLDPFASGCLIVAFGTYTKLFQFLNKTPKRYRATLWVGAKSESLDSERIETVETMLPFHPDSLSFIFQNLTGKHVYVPPKFSAKKIDGKRAYALAREDKEVVLAPVEMEIYEATLVQYCHPFITFEVSVSEGAYVRSIGQMISAKLGFDGALSALERLCEGVFAFEEERALDPLEVINLPVNVYKADEADFLDGKVLARENFETQEEGRYLVVFEAFFSIIDITPEGVMYQLNRMERC
ncbi:MAG: tRNA pseudouridine(55) synthase TruB [Campylobacterales bacterium]|nr:tRNA pseudouridine(55) synthase TruB [Campylobacterales bacterium]